MKKKGLLIAILVLCIASLSAFTACHRREFIPEIQGSSVMTIDNEEINNKVTTSYETFKDFKKSKYADMKIGGFDYVAKKSFYTNSFFRDKKLVVTKFNDMSNAKFFVSDIKVEGNHYTVSLTRLADTSIAKPTIQSYGLFLEVPEKHDVKDAIVDIAITNKDIAKSTALPSNSTSDSPIAISHLATYDELTNYLSNSDEATKAELSKYDEDFFVKNFLFVVDYSAFDRTITSVKYEAQSIVLYNYGFTHYAKKTDRTSRVRRFLPVPKGTVVNKVEIVSYGEADVDKPCKSDINKLEFATLNEQ